MPTYKNSNATVVTLNGNRMEAGESIQILEYLEGSLPAGVTQIATTPNFVPVKFSGLYQGGIGADSGAIPVPAGLQQYSISIAVGAGAVLVEMNGVTTANLSEAVVAGEKITFQCQNRIVDSLKLYYQLASTVAKVTIA